MSNGDGLRPRPGPAPKLIEGPKRGQRSLYQQHVLDEDTYTDALSHIIQRDFFPTLPHLNATNDYLSALANNDPELLSSSIRRLARIAQEKEDAAPRRRGRGRGSRSASETPSVRETEGERQIRQDFDMAQTPYMNVGARGWDTPRADDTVRRPAEAEDALDPGPSRKKRRAAGPQIRDDLSLDAFQRNYTSEDNASFAQIVEHENLERREEKAWAFEAERIAADKRIAWEEKRQLLLEAATNGGWRVDANGRRLVGGLAEGGRDRNAGEAWKERKMIAAPDGGDQNEEETGESQGPSDPKSALVHRQGGALIKATASSMAPLVIQEKVLPEDHPLSRALEVAGLPTTALVSTDDGAIVPHREAVSGAGDGRGRGEKARDERRKIEKDIMGREEREMYETQQWEYKTMNSLMFPPDAYTKPYPKADKPTTKPLAAHKQPAISYRSTRLQEEEDEPSGSRAGSTRRGSSPARSWIDAAVQGQDYIPREEREEYALVPEDADPDPEELPPLMTWGTLLATPRRLDGTEDDFSGPSFRLPENKKRDEIGRKLGAKASKSMSERAKAYAPSSSSTHALRSAASRTKTADRSVRAMNPPSATPRREGNLTPAARSLLDRSLGRTPTRLGSGGSARGAAMEKGSMWGKSSISGRSWTPSPAPKR